MNPLSVLLIGLNHNTAHVELREQMSFSSDEAREAVNNLYLSKGISEVLLASTCNRVEILMAVKSRSEAVNAAKKSISRIKGIEINGFEKSLYIHEDDNAVRHLFRVASSLDSMMVGEPQISGQIKQAYYLAVREKTTGVILNRLMHRAFFVAKRVRTETGIGDRAVSISYAAVELGKKIFGSLENKSVLLLGAGEMAELAVEHLIRNKTKKIVVANRTFENGVKLAKRFSGTAIRHEEILSSMVSADIVISSTGSPDLIITRDQIKKIMKARKNRPIFFIDIALPRDIDPAINRLPNSYVYDIDDLKDVIDENINDRNNESVKAERIVHEAVINFQKWHKGLEVVPTIIALRHRIDEIAGRELEKTVQSLNLSENNIQAVQKMMGSFINKILHDPIIFLKKNGCNDNNSLYIDTVKKLFNIDH